MKLPLFCLLLLASAGWLRATTLWTGAPSDLSRWQVESVGGAEAGAALKNGVLTLDSRSPLGAGRWLSVCARESFPVAADSEVTLRVRVAAVKAGRLFAALVFSPGGGESRLYLPSGSYPARDFEQTLEIPEGAARACLVIGVESETQAAAIQSVSVETCAVQRTHLTAAWLPQPVTRIFPRAPRPAEHLVALDLAGLSPDEVTLATTLQGLVNRSQPRIWLYQNPGDRFWARWLIERHDVQTIDPVPNLAALLARFSGEIHGVIVYDRALPASLHAAMMLGAIRGDAATSADVAAKYRLKVDDNLTGRWRRNVDAYRELWTKYRAEFAPGVLAVHYPFMTQQGPRDYLVQQKIFTFWVSGYADNDAGGDPAAELDFAHEVLAATPPNIPIMGWWSFGENQGIPEYDAVKLSSSYAKFLAGSEYCSNLSVLSGVPVPEATFRQRPTPDAVPLDHRLAATLSVLDSGDSQWYWEQYQLKLWQDPARGRTPINWSLNPTVLDVMPSVLAWYYTHATPNDLFFCALSGLGYMNPRTYGSRFRAEDRAKIWADYTRLLSVYMKALDLHLLEVYGGDWSEPRAGMDPIYGRFFAGVPGLHGILSDFGRQDATTPENGIEMIGGKPVFHTEMRWIPWTDPNEVFSQLEQQQRSVDFTLQEFLKNEPSERPALMSGLILSWTMSPSLVEKFAARLPSDVSLMNADALVEEAHRLPSK